MVSETTSPRVNPDFVHELEKRFSGDLKLDSASRILYSTDASIYQIAPLGVILPKTQEDLHMAVELAVKYRIPILPRGSGSSLGGQAIGEAILLDCSRYLDKIIEIDPSARSATVEPGVILSDLNRKTGSYGLMFGPDPASAERATLGGVIGNNATGAHSIRYGMSADHLLSGEVILGDGSLEAWKVDGVSILDEVIQTIRDKYADQIFTRYPRSWRNSAGYRLNYLLPWSPSIPDQWAEDDFGLSISVYRSGGRINTAALLGGSEGTLAVMRRIHVNLVPKPGHTILGVLAYDNIVTACEDVPRLLEFRPSAIELIPRLIIQLARSVPAYAHQMDWMKNDPAAILVVEFSGDTPSMLAESARRIGKTWVIAASPEEQARIWNIRKMGLGILDSRPRSARPAAFIEDCAIPVEHLGGFVADIQRILEDHNTEGGIYGHASAGCLHIRPILDLKTGDGIRSLRSIAEQVFQLTLKLGGSMSSEHGDGIVAGEWIEKTYGAELVDAMKMIKQTVDPHNLLNPGKMFAAPPMDTHLRFGESYQVKAWPATLKFDHEGGLAGAIEQCNGQGVCRKRTGVMCPSFQATRDEAFSTRGRANLLRALISSPMVDGFRSRNGMEWKRSKFLKAVYASLDLCLACKGCSAECPSGVDMPRLKYEFLNEYYKHHARPLRDYFFGYFHIVSRWIQPIAPLINVLTGVSWIRKSLARLLGLSPERPFPKFSHTTAKVPGMKKGAKTVLLLVDVFSRYIDAEVEQAALDILHWSGHEVRVLPVIGAGASLLSRGFIEGARSHANQILAAIETLGGGAEFDIVGCEPPEVYCLKHEYLSLLPDRSRDIERFRHRVWLLDEFLLRSEAFGRFLSKIESSNGRIVQDRIPITFHPHCHQRAEGLAEDDFPLGVSASVTLLRRFGFEVAVMDAGCCGMAGTFGYEAEHHQLSMQVGELGVLPAARMADRLVSTGSVCRMQIRHGAGKDVSHPLVLVRDRVRDFMDPARSRVD